MDEEGPRYWLWTLIGVGVGLLLGLLMVLSGTPSCGVNPSVRTASGDLGTMPEMPEKVEKGRQGQVQRGSYLASIAGCAYCHTPVDPLTGPFSSQALSGGTGLRSKHFGTLYSANLTPDLRSGLGPARTDIARLRSAARGGLSTWGYTMHPAAMPWYLLARADPEDVDCLLTFLTYSTAVSRAMPPRGAPGKNDPDGIVIELGSYSKKYEE